jgi:hypothetical protein
LGGVAWYYCNGPGPATHFPIFQPIYKAPGLKSIKVALPFLHFEMDFEIKIQEKSNLNLV